MDEDTVDELKKLVSESIALQRALNNRTEHLINIVQKISVDVSNSDAALSIIIREMYQFGLRNIRILEALKKDKHITLDIPYIGEAEGTVKGIKEP